MDTMMQRQSEVEKLLKSQKETMMKQAASIEYLVKRVAANDVVDRALGERGGTMGVRFGGLEDGAD